MPGNSRRRGALRKPGSKKGSVSGSGGQKSRGLRGKGPTPKATDRTAHPASTRGGRAGGPGGGRGAGPAGAAGQGSAGGSSAGRASAGRQSAGRGPSGGAGPGRGSGGGSRSSAGRGSPGRASGTKGSSEMVAGRNAVVEALRAQVPASALFVAARIDADDRVKEALKVATSRGVPLLEASRADLDRLTEGAVHQGLVLQVPAYSYADPGALLRAADDAGQAPLLVALDGVTDPRNLGAVVRSVGAFGGHGVIVPERRAAGMTASAWKSSAGAAARVPVARVTNLRRCLEDLREAGVFLVGLDMDGDVAPHELQVATEPVCLVVGSEGKGLSRMVRETCDVAVSVPMAAETESLNAGIATGVVLYAVDTLRRGGAGRSV